MSDDERRGWNKAMEVIGEYAEANGYDRIASACKMWIQRPLTDDEIGYDEQVAKRIDEPPSDAT